MAAGPVGRAATADTDWKLRAQVFSYSRARGVFAGLELSGAGIHAGSRQHARILRTHGAVQDLLAGGLDAPQGAYPFLSTLAKWAKTASK